MSEISEVVMAAYSKATELAYLPNLYFAQFAKKRTWEEQWRAVKPETSKHTICPVDPMPGDFIDFIIPGTSVLAGEVHKPIELKEYGDLVTLTNKLRITAFDNIDLAAARVVGNNMGTSIDLIARATYDAQVAGAYVTYAGGGTTPSGVGPGDIITAELMRKIYNKLERANVPKLEGGFYIAILHPDVIFDLRNEGYGTAANTGTWRAPREYVSPDKIYNGEVGEFEGFRIISTSNARIQTGAGSGGTDVYTSYFLGYQAVAYAEGIKPDIRITGPFDNLGRTLNVGWYALVGFGELRPEALYKLFSASSVS